MSYGGSSSQRYFNPRTREGCDILPQISKSSEEISTHAPVKGATVCRCRPASQITTDFNPRTREGCDGVRDPMVREFWEFQPTHP